MCSWRGTLKLCNYWWLKQLNNIDGDDNYVDGGYNDDDNYGNDDADNDDHHHRGEIVKGLDVYYISFINIIVMIPKKRTMSQIWVKVTQCWLKWLYYSSDVFSSPSWNFKTYFSPVRYEARGNKKSDEVSFRLTLAYKRKIMSYSYWNIGEVDAFKVTA